MIIVKTQNGQNILKVSNLWTDCGRFICTAHPREGSLMLGVYKDQESAQTVLSDMVVWMDTFGLKKVYEMPTQEMLDTGTRNSIVTKITEMSEVL